MCIDMASTPPQQRRAGACENPQSPAALTSLLFFSAGDYPFSARTRIFVTTDFSTRAAMFLLAHGRALPAWCVTYDPNPA